MKCQTKSVSRGRVMSYCFRNACSNAQTQLLSSESNHRNPFALLHCIRIETSAPTQIDLLTAIIAADAVIYIGALSGWTRTMQHGRWLCWSRSLPRTPSHLAVIRFSRAPPAKYEQDRLEVSRAKLAIRQRAP